MDTLKKGSINEEFYKFARHNFAAAPPSVKKWN